MPKASPSKVTSRKTILQKEIQKLEKELEEAIKAKNETLVARNAMADEIENALSFFSSSKEAYLKNLTLIAAGTFSAFSVFLGSIENPTNAFLILTGFVLVEIFTSLFLCLKSMDLVSQLSYMKEECRRNLRVQQIALTYDGDVKLSGLENFSIEAVKKSLDLAANNVTKLERNFSYIVDFLLVGIALAGVSYILLGIGNL